jgi:hypothetical protein
MSAPMREMGLDIDMPSLVYAGTRSHVMDYLSSKGWQVSGAARDELFTRYGRPRPVLSEETDPLGEIVYVSAKRDAGNPGWGAAPRPPGF